MSVLEALQRPPVLKDAVVSGSAIALVLAGLAYFSEVTFVLPQVAPASLAWGLFYYVVMIGLAEELLFRVLPQSLLGKRPLATAVLGSTAFALYHINSGALMLPYFFAFGILFAVLRQGGVSLLVLAVAHGLFDVALNLVWKISGFRFGVEALQVGMPLFILFVAALAGWCLSAAGGRSPSATNTNVRADENTDRTVTT